MPLDLPPQFKQQVEEKIPQLRRQVATQWGALQQFLDPLWREFGPQIMGWVAQAKKSLQRAPQVGDGPRLGEQFRHLLVVGLNKSELLLQGETTPVWNDTWVEMLDDTMKKHLGLVFFAPRGLDGQPVPPLPFLLGEEEGAPTPAAAASVLQGVALLDFCRMPPAAPNTVNMLVAADCLFHWDSKDNYVLPINSNSWNRDVEQVLRGYPRTTRAHVFTNWDTSLLPQSERITAHSLRALPLARGTWLNEPTLQERYGNHMLLAGLVVAVLMGIGLWWQGRSLQNVTDQLDMVQQQIPRGGQFSDLERAVTEQEKMFARRPLFALAVKDANRAVQQSGLQIAQMELKVPDANAVPDSYLLTLTMPDNAYNGWLQQEPAARGFILNSALLHAVRKPPSTTGFKLEGLVMLAPWLREYNRLKPQLPSSLAPTLEVSATQNLGTMATGGQP
ncbi:MAG: hypothetical protein INF43_05490 [Alphaproteobacteria bacterium]|jgi:hypothetical protein|nr:hypothetical protein [Alphaproteobacteria bacterium]